MFHIHRLHQINFVLGNYDEATNALIDALKWNPENENALIMMGNIFASEKNDLDTALKYYNRVTEITKDNFIALNNIGAVLLKNNRVKEGLEFLNKSFRINPNYPNTLFAFAVYHYNSNEYNDAFSWCLKTLKAANPKDEVFQQSLNMALEVAKGVHDSDQIKKVVDKYQKKVELECGRGIKHVPDDSIPTPAKIEIAEYH